MDIEDETVPGKQFTPFSLFQDKKISPDKREEKNGTHEPPLSWSSSGSWLALKTLLEPRRGPRNCGDGIAIGDGSILQHQLRYISSRYLPSSEGNPRQCTTPTGQYFAGMYHHETQWPVSYELSSHVTAIYNIWSAHPFVKRGSFPACGTFSFPVLPS